MITTTFTSSDIVTNSATIISDLSVPLVVSASNYYDAFIAFSASSIGSVTVEYDDDYSAWTRNNITFERLTNPSNIDKLYALHLSFYKYIYEHGGPESRSVQFAISATTEQGNIHKYATITLSQSGCVATYTYKLNTNALSTAYSTVDSVRINSGVNATLEETDEVYITINPAQKTYSGITTGYCEFFGFVTTGIDRSNITELSRTDSELRFKFTMPSNNVTLTQDFEQGATYGNNLVHFSVNPPILLEPSISPISDNYCPYDLVETTTGGTSSVKSLGYYVKNGVVQIKNGNGMNSYKTRFCEVHITLTAWNRALSGHLYLNGDIRYFDGSRSYKQIFYYSQINTVMTFSLISNAYKIVTWKVDRVKNGGIYAAGSGVNALLPMDNGEYGNNYFEKNFGLTLTGNTSSFITPNFNFTITPIIVPENFIIFVSEQENSKISLNSSTSPNLEISTDNGVTWTVWDYSEITLNNVGDSLCMRGTNPNGFSTQNNRNTFIISGAISVNGSIMKLINYSQHVTTIPNDYCFCELFKGCTGLTSAPQLLAETLTSHCYDAMFQNCTNLIKTPEMYAVTLADYCCSNMYDGCTSLSGVLTDFRVESLAPYCFYGMFSGCTSFTSFTIDNMFTFQTLPVHCYDSMFFGCTGLTQTPILRARKLTEGCYCNMFNGCSSIREINCAADSGLTSADCTTNWVNGVSSSGSFNLSYHAGYPQFPRQPDNTWVSGTNGVPNGWQVYSRYK